MIEVYSSFLKRFTRIKVLLILTIGLANISFAESDQLLEADQAFRFSAQMNASDEIQISWQIADGYYMYRERFSVSALNGAAVLGEPVFPQGKKKQDELFGEVEVYEEQVTYTVPVSMITENGLGAKQLEIEVIGQGCNEPIGICYPPLKKTAVLQLAALQSSASQQSTMSDSNGSLDSLQSLSDLLSTGIEQPQFLTPDEAFQFELTRVDRDLAKANFTIAKGYYLYKDKVDISSAADNLSVAGLNLPEGVEKTDEYFGEMMVFYNGFEAQVPVTWHEQNKGETLATFDVTYQGCADEGICYPPVKTTVTLDFLGISDASAAQLSPSSGISAAGPGSSWSFIWPIALAFGAGLLLTFTPCVLPMVPILASMVAGQRQSRSQINGGMLAGIYVLGTAVTYAAMGVVAGLTGDQLQAYFQNVWAIGSVALVLVLLALSMFGVYKLQMPSAVQSWLQNRISGAKAGAVSGVFVMGLVSALIVGACVSPVLISVLALAIDKGDPVLGGAIMFSMALGMGIFLILVGWGVDLLPKAGPWMERINHIFGLMLLAVAIYLLGNIRSVPVLYLWSGLLVISSVYLGAFSTTEGKSGWYVLQKGVALLAFVWGVLALMGAMAGNRDILKPIDYRTMLHGQQVAVEHARFERVWNLQQLDARLETAMAQGKPVLLDYYADWCVDCIRMEKSTFQDIRVSETLNKEFLLLQVDVTDASNDATNSIKKRYNVFGPPAMLFFDELGNEIDTMRRYGYMDSDAFLEHIDPLRG